jgi:hypothetical protein
MSLGRSAVPVGWGGSGSRFFSTVQASQSNLVLPGGRGATMLRDLQPKLCDPGAPEQAQILWDPGEEGPGILFALGRGFC